MRDICTGEKIQPGQVVLHSDNGSPMKGATVLATLQRLGVVPSFSRPSVSNDNPYSASLFKTLKYRPRYVHLPPHDFAAVDVHEHVEVKVHAANRSGQVSDVPSIYRADWAPLPALHVACCSLQLAAPHCGV